MNRKIFLITGTGLAVAIIGLTVILQRSDFNAKAAWGSFLAGPRAERLMLKDNVEQQADQVQASQAAQTAKSPIEYTGSQIIPERTMNANDFKDSADRINSGKKSNVELYTASSGERFILQTAEGQESKLAELKDIAEKRAAMQQNREKEFGRSETEKAKAMDNIKTAFGAKNLKYVEIAPVESKEWYADDEGFDYFVSTKTNKVIERRTGKDFEALNSDIINGNGWKAVNITKDQARSIVEDFIRNKSSLSESKAEEVIASMQSDIAKYNSYGFLYGDDGSGLYGNKSWALEIVIEPVTGKIIHYANALVK